MQHAARISNGIGRAIVLIELSQLGSLIDQPRAGALVGKVDLVPVPGELPSDHYRDDAALFRRRPNADNRSTERSGQSGNRAGMFADVEDFDRPRSFHVGVRRDGANRALIHGEFDLPWKLKLRTLLDLGRLRQFHGELVGELAGTLDQFLSLGRHEQITVAVLAPAAASRER